MDNLDRLIRDYIQENLAIELELNQNHSGDRHIEVRLLLCGETISSDYIPNISSND